jgi:phage N-6-adenine-methyltransferase
MSMEFHPLANTYRLLRGEEFDALVEDIKANGLLSPIWTFEGKILDGRNRWLACEAAGVATRTMREYQGDDPIAFIQSMNSHRRHDDESQRALVAARLAALPRGRPENASIDAITQAQAAELFNVSRPSVQRARVVLERGVPELVEAVDEGMIAVSAAAEATDLPEDEQRRVVEAAKAGEKASEAIRHFRTQFTGENEWYTPEQYVESARLVLGEIDLDPASNPQAQQTVRAARYYTAETNGLKHEWHGRIWLNPPYAQPLVMHFVEKLVAEVRAGRISQAIMLTHNYTDTAWFHHAESEAGAICFTRGRIRFVRQDGFSASPTQGQAFFYFGENIEKFETEFRKHGFVR